MNSPFIHHLYSNHVPSIEEVTQIKDLLPAPQEELSHLDSEIHRLQQQLDDLRSRRAALANDIDAHRALISLIRRLPHEVMQEIFIACLPDGRNPCMTALEAPMLLTRVCSSWRTLAMSTPELWARIHIMLPDNLNHIYTARLGTTTFSIQHKETAVSEWLSRSGNHPLSISVYHWQESLHSTFPQPPSELRSCPSVSFFENVLIPHARRWYNIKLYTTPKVFGVVLNIPAFELPMLRKLDISSPRTVNPWDPSPTPSTTWSDLPILQSPHFEAITLSLPDYPLQLSDVNILKRWTRLTDLGLRISGSSPADSYTSTIYAILQSCPLLESLRLSAETTPAGPIPSYSVSKRIYLPKLTRLGIAIEGQLDCLSFFCHALEAPLLQHFKLDHIVQPWLGQNESFFESIYRPLKSFLTVFGENFISWTLSPLVPEMQASDYLALLELTPCLQELSITCRYLDVISEWVPQHARMFSRINLNDDFIQGLTPFSGQENLENIVCPQLETFRCIAGVLPSFSESAIFEFVRGKRELALRGIGQPIRHIEVALPHPSNDNSTLKLPPYSEEGVQGALVYLRRPARGPHSPYTGLPFSPEEIAMEVDIAY